MRFLILVILINLFGVEAQTEEERVQIRLSGGLIEGRVVRFGRRVAYAFMGVPFAEPPIGDLRFRPTRLKSSWEGVWDATRYGPPCAQRTKETILPLYDSSEDCLHVNVYTAPRCFERPCPVLFYVHGGGFYFDAPTMFNETLIMQNFASHDIVFVMPAYRLGIFGFLDTGSDDLPDIPQNAGILDLITALRWTQLELQRFGGDPRRMTVIGNSAGAHLAFILLQSPLVEKAAFQSAIISSGMIGIRRDSCTKMTEEVMKRVECFHSFSNLQSKIDCMRTKTTDELLNAMSDTEPTWIEITPQPDTFVLPAQSVSEFLQNWQGLPLIVLTTQDEFFMTIRPTVESKCKHLVENFGYPNPKTVDACIQYYTTVSNLNYTVRDAYHAFMHRLAAINTQQGASCCWFKYKGYPTFAALFAQPHGLRHADDLKYLLGLHPIKPKDKDDDDLKMDVFYPKIIRKFIRDGPDGMEGWAPTDDFGRNYYWMRFQQSPNSSTLIDWPHMVHGEFFQPKETNFWLEDLKEINDGADHKEVDSGIDIPHRPPPPPPKIHEEPSAWLAFWLVLGVCVVLAVALSSIIFYWISARLKVLGMVVDKDDGQKTV
ncbi:Carboxylic ester hydrolase [Aphelenchoides bicaudatus]|nr:Carboxylic ester hydrolase [Aphelenchoides bicaudatus]